MPIRFTFLFVLWLGLNFSFAQSIDIEKCKLLLSKEELSLSDFSVIDSLIFGINYYDSDVPRQLYTTARSKALKQNLPEVYLNFDMWLADLFYEIDERDSCQHYAKQVATMSKELGLDLWYARSANIRRLLLTGKNNFSEAYTACFEALEIFESRSNLDGMGVANRDIGSIKLLEKKYNDALNYCKKSEKFLLQAENWYELTFTFQRIAIIYRNLGKFDLAHEYILKSRAASEKLYGFRVDQGLAKNYWTEGYVYEEEGEYDLALASFETARIYGSRINLKKLERSIINNIGEIRLKTGQYELALENFQNALLLTNELSLKQYGYDYYVPLYQNMAIAYEGLNDYKNANFLLNRIANDKDSLFTLASEKAVAELQTKYETAQKEAQIGQLENEKIIQKNFIIFGGIALFALTFAALILYRNNRFKVKTNKQLQQQKIEIEAKSKQNELLLKEIHHRVKNNLQTISSLLSLQSESIKDQAAINAVEESRNRVKSMALIHQKLYQGENLASIEMRNYFETMGNALIESFGQNAGNVSLEIEMSEIELDVDTAIPLGLITNELITNSLKYAFPEKKGKISISLSKIDQDTSELTIADNGTPMKAANSSDESGFGSFLIQLLTTQLGGHLQMSQKNGTTAVLKFPSTLKSAI